MLTSNHCLAMTTMTGDSIAVHELLGKTAGHLDPLGRRGRVGAGKLDQHVWRNGDHVPLERAGMKE